MRPRILWNVFNLLITSISYSKYSKYNICILQPSLIKLLDILRWKRRHYYSSNNIDDKFERLTISAILNDAYTLSKKLC